MLLHSNPLVDKCLHVEELFFLRTVFFQWQYWALLESLAVFSETLPDFTPARRNSRRLSISLELGANLVEVGSKI